MPKDDDEKKGNDAVTLPIGRLTFHSMFVRDVYKPKKGAEGEPMYKAEMVWHDADAIAAINDIILDVIEEEWGTLTDEEADEIIAGKSAKFLSPLKSGDKYAAKEPDKNREVYEGGFFLRTHTKFNKHGQPEVGGIMIYNESLEEVEATEQETIYGGQTGRLCVVPHTYIEEKTGNKCVTFFLTAYQRVADGDRLVSPRDYSSLFQKVEKSGGDGSRRSRREAAED